MLACLASLLLMGALLGAAAPADAAQATPKKHHVFTPTGGVTFNNPYGSATARRAIIRKILHTIDSVPRGAEIRIASWNVRSYNVTAALLRAHRRGVSVQVVMDHSNWAKDNANADAAKLHAGLAKGNKKRVPSRRSWLRRCDGACRGPHGIAHTKFFLFSKAGRAKDVVIYGSNNATELAANIQWNDIYTRLNRPAEYAVFEGVFHEMARDKRPVGGGYRQYTTANYSDIFYPDQGKSAPKGDPVLKVLSRVRCTGATGPGVSHGHTKLRIAQTAMYGKRGIAIAQRLAQMHRRGCDIRIVYAMFGNEVLRILRREAGATGIPLTHLAWDRNDDGIYDSYVHMKSLAIRGNYGGSTHATLTINGSANWTPVALNSDEVLGMLTAPGVNRAYLNWIDFLFTHRPASWGADSGGGGGVERHARAAAVDPYELIKQDL